MISGVSVLAVVRTVPTVGLGRPVPSCLPSSKSERSEDRVYFPHQGPFPSNEILVERCPKFVSESVLSGVTLSCGSVFGLCVCM